MKRDINPIYGIVALVCVVLIAVYFLYHASVDKPAYPGLNAGHPGYNGSGSRVGMTGTPSPHMTEAEAAKMHIPGVSPPMNQNAGQPPANGTPPSQGQ